MKRREFLLRLAGGAAAGRASGVDPSDKPRAIEMTVRQGFVHDTLVFHDGGTEIGRVTREAVDMAFALTPIRAPRSLKP